MFSSDQGEAGRVGHAPGEGGLDILPVALGRGQAVVAVAMARGGVCRIEGAVERLDGAKDFPAVRFTVDQPGGDRTASLP